MATFLDKLGRFAFRRRGVVALVWLALLAVAFAGARSAGDPPADDFSLPGTESQQTLDLLEERFPQAGLDGATARVVFRAPEGEKIAAPEHREAVRQVLAELKGPQTVNVADPFTSGAVSRDGTTAYSTVTYKVPSTELTDATRDALQQAAEEGREAGLTVEVGGDALLTIPEMGSAEIVGVVVAAVVLILTFGSLVAAGLPLVTALVGIGIGTLGISALAVTLGLSSVTGILATMIGLAVGIDYALFIASRYRAELIAGRDREEAAGRAVATAGSAVVFAGLTVVIALAGLAVVNIPVLTKMGLAAAATVAIAVLVALTLVPAALGFVGKRIFGRRVRRENPSGVPAPAETSGKVNMGTRWARGVVRRPLLALAAGVLTLGVVAVPVGSLQLGLPDEGSQPPDTTQRKAYDMLAESFGPGTNGPLMVAVDTRDSGADPVAAAGAVSKRVAKLDGVVAATPPTLKSKDAAIITVVPATGPTDEATEKLVRDIRDRADALAAGTGATVLVTGSTALAIDFSQVLDEALAPYLALVVGLAFLLLMVVFRSVLVPLKAALGFLLSVLAALGAVVAVFQWGWLGDLLGVEQTGPIMSLTPIFLIGVVFGLAMDYEVFLVTRMREARAHGEEPKQAVVTGFTYGARVVTAAAVIMISVFAGFVGMTEPMIKMMGFGLAIAVLFDAFVVRMTIVPAVLALLGRSAWWLPRWLDRVLPQVDVEGEGHRPDEPSAPAAAAGEDREPSRV